MRTVYQVLTCFELYCTEEIRFYQAAICSEIMHNRLTTTTKLEQEEKELEKKERLESMRKELAAKREKVTTLKGTTKAQKDSKTSKHTKTNDTSVKKSKQ